MSWVYLCRSSQLNVRRRIKLLRHLTDAGNINRWPVWLQGMSLIDSQLYEWYQGNLYLRCFWWYAWGQVVSQEFIRPPTTNRYWILYLFYWSTLELPRSPMLFQFTHRGNSLLSSSIPQSGRSLHMCDPAHSRWASNPPRSCKNGNFPSPFTVLPHAASSF